MLIAHHPTFVSKCAYVEIFVFFRKYSVWQENDPHNNARQLFILKIAITVRDG